MTKQRQAVLEVIRDGKRHLTAEEIFTEAKKKLPTISRATVYNSLHALVADKQIRRITAEDASDRYDSSYIPHGHLFCTGCQRVADFNVPTFVETIEKIVGEKIESYELKVRYLCETCKRARENA